MKDNHKSYVKGPNWKKIWRHQKHFLVHRLPSQELIVCGRTPVDWCKIFLFALVFYVVLFCFAWGCWKLFVVIIIAPSGRVPYRKGYTFANEKIPNEMGHLKHLAKEVGKRIPDKSSFGSPLDFPMLTSLPKHFAEEDDEEGYKRDRVYQNHATFFWLKARKVNDQLAEAAEQGNTTNVRECTAKNFAAARLKDDIEKTVCQLESFQEIEKKCYQGKENEWGWQMPENLSTKSYTPCFLLKLNKIVGFVPAPMKGEHLMKAWGDAANDNGTSSMLIFPTNETLAKLKDNYGDKDYPKLPVTCWFGLSRGGQPVGDNLTKFLNEDFLEFIPAAEGSNGTLGEMDLRAFPYFQQHNYLPAMLGVKLKFNDKILPDDVLTMECRILASNVPFKYKLELSPAVKYGHLRLRMKYYTDEMAGRHYLKLEK